MIARTVFLAALVLVATGLLSPPLALASGVVFALLFAHPYAGESKRWSKVLLPASVVALGFGMNFDEVMRTGKASFFYTAVGITCGICLGLVLGRVFRVRNKAAFLIAAGTAICGGSAIAAIAPITNPDEEELAMSMGTVFTLNSVALLLFPMIGYALHLTQPQFGLWAALAIHDTSSVIGAAAKFGSHALAIGTAVKLTRALWIVPVALLTALFSRSKAKVKLPWFILLFCLAALSKSYVTAAAPIFAVLVRLGHLGLAATLFLIGSGLNASTLRRAGARVMLQGVILWIAVAGVSLWAIRAGWIGL